MQSTQRCAVSSQNVYLIISARPSRVKTYCHICIYAMVELKKSVLNFVYIITRFTVQWLQHSE